MTLVDAETFLDIEQRTNTKGCWFCLAPRVCSRPKNFTTYVVGIADHSINPVTPNCDVISLGCNRSDTASQSRKSSSSRLNNIPSSLRLFLVSKVLCLGLAREIFSLAETFQISGASLSHCRQLESDMLPSFSLQLFRYP